ncbi:consortin-like isoform X2, partial [Clarias magur]
MGDPKTEKDLSHQDDGVTLWPSNTEQITDSDFSVSHEIRDKLIVTETMDWSAEKNHTIHNNQEEISTVEEDDTMRVSLDTSASDNNAPGPSPAFLAALSSLGEHTDHMLLPRSLHQIADTYFHEENYQWAVQFLHLEMLYHERLISNIAFMQKDWESQGKGVSQAKNCSSVKIHCTESETKCMNALNFICRTHQRPNCNVEKQISAETPLKMKDWTEDPEEENGDEEEDREALGQEALTEEVQEEVPGRLKLSGEKVSELIKVEETSTSNGLISILKKRTSPEESYPVNPSPDRSSSKLKVRFSETDDFLDNDDMGEDSCLFFLALCLVTVVISMG